MSDSNSGPESPKSNTPTLILVVVGVVGALIGAGRCGAFGSRVDNYGASGALFLVVSGILLITALVTFIRHRR